MKKQNKLLAFLVILLVMEGCATQRKRMNEALLKRLNRNSITMQSNKTNINTKNIK